MKTPYSIWFWACATLAAALACLLAPQQAGAWLAASTELPPGAAVLGRLLGVALLGYGAAYAVAAWSGERAFMRASVWLRAAMLPGMAAMVALQWLPPVLLLLGVSDLLGALWTRHELRQHLN